MAELLQPDGSRSTVAPADAKHGFTLGELYRVLACQTIEAVYLPDRRVMIVDEEAKLHAERPPHNAAATRLFHEAGGLPWDMVLGPALVCSRREFK